MKQNILFYLSAFLCLTVMACKKEQSSEAVASLTMINAVAGCDLISTDFSGKSVDKSDGGAPTLYYGVYMPQNHLTIQAKEQSLLLFKSPFAANDLPLFQLKLKPAAGDIISLFLTGTLAQPESFLVTAKTPYYTVKDSLLGLRFVNLSADSGPVRVKVSGQGLPADIISSDLVYKGITSYLPVSANAGVGDLKVEFFDQASGKLLGSINLPEVGATSTNNSWRYRNYTIALKGLPNATNLVNQQGLLLIYDY